jgi:glycosyltransferase involved in cell wall biosynthesis
LAAKIREFKPDLIYERYAFFASAGSDLAFDLGIPHIIEINYTCDDPLVRKRSRLLISLAQRVERKIFGRGAVLAPVSSRLTERVLARGVDPGKIVMTPNAVDRSWLERVASVTPRELPPGMRGLPVTGFVGGFWPWHGVDRLVATAGRCREQGLPTALLLVGEGPERERIGQMVKELGLEETTLMPGNIAHEKLAPWIAAMDICVMPHSNDYGSPMKVFEYMGMGRAVLAPNLPPLVDVIDSGVGGLLFKTDVVGGKPEVAESLEDGLSQLLRDGSLRQKMGAVALERVTREFTWQNNWDRLMAGLPQPPDGDPVNRSMADTGGEVER